MNFHLTQDVDADPLWTARSLVDNPEAVQQVHTDFIQAGARIILTDSYQVSLEGFKKYLDLDSEATHNAIVKSVKLVKSAVIKAGKAPGYVLIGGSVGPYGACQHDGSEYTGAYLDGMTREELSAWHMPRIQALLEGGVSFLAIETLPCWREALAVLDCVAACGGFIPVWVSFTIKDENTLAGGKSIQDAVKAVRKHPLYAKGRVFALGINCSMPNHVSAAIDNIRSITKTVPVVVYPNSGEVWNGSSRVWEGGVEENWDRYFQDWVKKGVLVLGGCCRVDASMINELKLAATKTLARILNKHL